MSKRVVHRGNHDSKHGAQQSHVGVKCQDEMVRRERTTHRWDEVTCGVCLAAMKQMRKEWARDDVDSMLRDLTWVDATVLAPIPPCVVDWRGDWVELEIHLDGEVTDTEAFEDVRWCPLPGLEKTDA